MARLIQIGWEVEFNKPILASPSEKVLNRYSSIPADYLCFLRTVSRCVSPTKTTWVLCNEDFDGTSSSAFAWNEWEKICLEVAGNNATESDEIISFWDHHVPVVYSVYSGYAFLAIEQNSEGAKSIVVGYEPDFKVESIVAQSFIECMEMISKIGFDTSLSKLLLRFQ